MKQTAVEFYRHGLYALTKRGNITVEEEEELFEQANQMFKEQIMDAANGYTQTEYLGVTKGEQYYNQEYGKNINNNTDL